VKSDHN